MLADDRQQNAAAYVISLQKTTTRADIDVSQGQADLLRADDSRMLWPMM